MKKVLIKAFATAALIACGFASQAQNYKASKIGADGKVTDESGKTVAWVTKEGVIKDEKGQKVAFVDSDGHLVDGTGKKLGKAAKNGNFHDATGEVRFSTHDKEGEETEIKDATGKIVVVSHDNYKNHAASVAHYLKKK